MLSIDGSPVPEDYTPGPQKLAVVEDGFILHNVTGIRTHMVRRLDGKGYDIVKCRFFPSSTFLSSDILVCHKFRESGLLEVLPDYETCSGFQTSARVHCGSYDPFVYDVTNHVTWVPVEKTVDCPQHEAN